MPQSCVSKATLKQMDLKCFIRGCQSWTIFYLSSKFFFKNIMCWQKTSGLANQSSPTLTTPKCIKYQKISYIYLLCICTRRFESHGATDLRQGINRSISARFAGREGNAKHMDATTRPTIST